jgi:hypothetical protein
MAGYGVVGHDLRGRIVRQVGVVAAVAGFIQHCSHALPGAVGIAIPVVQRRHSLERCVGRRVRIGVAGIARHGHARRLALKILIVTGAVAQLDAARNQLDRQQAIGHAALGGVVGIVQLHARLVEVLNLAQAVGRLPVILFVGEPGRRPPGVRSFNGAVQHRQVAGTPHVEKRLVGELEATIVVPDSGFGRREAGQRCQSHQHCRAPALPSSTIVAVHILSS